MRYVPTSLQASELSKRVVAGSTALAIVLSIVLSTVSTATVYAGSEEALLSTPETTQVSEETVTDVDAVETPASEVVDAATEIEETTTETQSAAAALTQKPSAKTQAVVDCEVETDLQATAVCEDEKTLREIVDETPTTSTLSAALSVLDEYEGCYVVSLFDELSLEDDLTVFAPSDTAFESLVRAPGSSMDEISELLNNPDELCELISYHVHAGEIFSADIPASVVIDTFARDDELQVKKNAQGVFVDQAKVVLADVDAANGVAHIIDDVLLPQETGTINPVNTNSTSPKLSGSTGIMIAVSEAYEPVVSNICVTVRVDGIAYEAIVTGSTWTIPKGTVTIDPFKASTLFDVIVRYCNDYQDRVAAQDHESKGSLIGLTMVRDVVSYKTPTTPDDDGEVLGETDDKTPISPAVATYSSAGIACGKGLCFGNTAPNTPQTTDKNKDTDGDGVVDSEDPEPNNPEVDGTEDQAANEENKQDENQNENSSQAFWWFIGGGGIALLWYLLWQRGGKESL